MSSTKLFLNIGNTTNIERGVAIVMKNKLVNSVTKAQCNNDHLMYVNVGANPVDALILKCIYCTC